MFEFRKVAGVALALLAVIGAVCRAQGSARGFVKQVGLPSMAPARTAHPAVVRVAVKESDGESFGSGTLIDVRERFGLIVTNWHVVRDAAGEISVAFPDGFRSAARIVKADKDWDLAALSIWRPPAPAVSIARQAPAVGDLLTIAGYGQGEYREAQGRCTQYLAPSDKHPFEIVELSATARQGDSGGPILNQRGELAGVLFGTVDGTTSGTYAGRIHEFLGSVLSGENSLASHEPARAPQGDAAPPIAVPPLLDDGSTREEEAPAKKGRGRARAKLAGSLEPLEQDPNDRRGLAGVAIGDRTYVADEPPTIEAYEPRASLGDGIDWIALLGETPYEQGKSALAVVGVLAILIRIGRLGAGGEKG